MGYAWNLETDGGKVESVTLRSSLYRDVAAAAPALLAKQLPFDVTVWGDLAPEKSLSFRLREDEYGRFVVETLVRK